MAPEPLTIEVGSGRVSGELLAPAVPRAVLVLAHGAGADFRHATLVSISEALAVERIATLRFNFPFMEAGRRRVDARPVAVDTIVHAAAAAATRLPGVSLCVGGHSFGGRMASHALAEQRVLARALICLSFPLHPAGRPGVDRAAHLGDVTEPMLFLSGTRDDLARADLMESVVAGLPNATLHWLDDADHGYRTRKRVRRDPRPVYEEMAEWVADFVAKLD